MCVTIDWALMRRTDKGEIKRQSAWRGHVLYVLSVAQSVLEQGPCQRLNWSKTLMMTYQSWHTLCTTPPTRFAMPQGFMKRTIADGYKSAKFVKVSPSKVSHYTIHTIFIMSKPNESVRWQKPTCYYTLLSSIHEHDMHNCHHTTCILNLGLPQGPSSTKNKIKPSSCPRPIKGITRLSLPKFKWMVSYKYISDSISRWYPLGDFNLPDM